MSRRYFKLRSCMDDPERWLVGDMVDEQGKEVKARLFMSGAPIQFDERPRVTIYHPGRALDYSDVDPGGIPMVTQQVASVLAAVAPGDVQFFPVHVESRPEPYFLVNVTHLIQCIDEETSEEVRYWGPEDGRPDKVGQYLSVYGMRIDPSKVGQAKLFRPWGHTGTLLVDEEVKQALEGSGATGLCFTEVTGPSPISQEERAYKKRCRELLEPPPAARKAVWKSLGSLDELACPPSGICYEWPGYRQVWQVIHRPKGRILLVTDGLSDPFIARMEPSVGFGLELALETDQPLGIIRESWPFKLLERVGQQLIAHEPLREAAKEGLVALEVSGKGLPPSLMTDTAQVGMLLGVESSTLPRQFPTPFGQVRLVTVKALLPPEWTWLCEHGEPGRVELARRFAHSGEEHLSSLQRHAAL